MPTNLDSYGTISKILRSDAAYGMSSKKRKARSRKDKASKSYPTKKPSDLGKKIFSVPKAKPTDLELPSLKPPKQTFSTTSSTSLMSEQPVYTKKKNFNIESFARSLLGGIAPYKKGNEYGITYKIKF
jgi:hypothetical protein